MTKQIKIAIIIFVILIIAAGGYFAYIKYFSQKSPEPQTVIEPRPEKPAPQGIKSPLGWKLYKSSEFGFQIQYPETWIVAVENIENVRGEQTKGFFFKKPNSDLRFAILPRDGLSYGVGAKGTSTQVFIGGSPGVQTQYILKDGRRLWLLFPQYGLNNWLQDLGRIDAMTSTEDLTADSRIFEQMLNSFKLAR